MPSTLRGKTTQQKRLIDKVKTITELAHIRRTACLEFFSDSLTNHSEKLEHKVAVEKYPSLTAKFSLPLSTIFAAIIFTGCDSAKD